MRRKIVPLTVFAICQLGVLLAIFISSRQLPARVASHFNAAGTPDGWMTRSAFVWLMAAFTSGLALFLAGVFYAIRFFPPSTINLPNREYWLAPERRSETLEAVFRAGVWLAILTTIYTLALHLLVVAANTTQPVKLSSYVWLLLVGFLLMTALWAYRLIVRFYRMN